jgi:hypothetical protein
MNIKKLFIIILFSATIVFPQDYVLKSDREIIPVNFEAFRKIKNTKMNYYNIQSKYDTLNYKDFFIGTSLNFGYFGQEVIVQLFFAPGDLIVRGVGYKSTENQSDTTKAEIKLVKFNWSMEQLDTTKTQQLGYYLAEGNGFNDITAFIENEDRTGEWVDASQSGIGSPFGEFLWEGDNEKGVTIPDPDLPADIYNWIELNSDSEIKISKDEIFGVAIKNLSMTMGGDRLGLRATDGLGFLTGFKFYPNGRFPDSISTKGWWSRHYIWDIIVGVEITGDVSPVIKVLNNYTSIRCGKPFTISAKITDENPSGGNAGVSFANLYYFYNNTWETVEMELDSNDIYTAKLPAFNRVWNIDFYIEACDVMGNCARTKKDKILIGCYITTNLLVVFNGFDSPSGFPQEYYLNINDSLYSYYDVWCYGELTDVMLSSYKMVFEITTDGPDYDNTEAIKNWLLSSNLNCYALIGQDWLSSRYSTDTTLSVGDFEFDLFGINKIYNDISSAADSPSKLIPMENSILGGTLYTEFTSMQTDSLLYDPFNELEMENRIDGFDVINKDNVDLKAEVGNLSGEFTLDTIVVIAHNITSNGNKTAFLSFDPLAIISRPNYFNFGYSNASPVYQAYLWFSTGVGIKEKYELLKDFKLYQNYPNPFNSTTKIRFTIPFVETGHAPSLLRIYDVLGKEIATLVNEEKPPGTYEVMFSVGSFGNASNLSSGVYYYQLRSGDFVETKNMILLR